MVGKRWVGDLDVPSYRSIASGLLGSLGFLNPLLEGIIIPKC